MKIKKEGYDIEKPLSQKIQVVLKTKQGELVLECDPLPLGWYNQIEKKLPEPKPPHKGFVRDNKGRFIRDDRTGKPLIEYDEGDPGYIEAKAEHDKRQNAALIYAILSTSPDISFSSDKSKPPIEFYDSVYQELLQAGMTTGQMLAIIRAVNQASDIDEEDLKVAKKN